MRPGGGRLVPLVVFAVTVLALLPGLGAQYVWSKDEARDGLVARDMVERGHWLIPHIGNRVYPYKPPLFHWLVALLSPGGVTERSLRLPSVLAAGGAAAVTCAMGARLVAPGAGLAAAAMLVSSPAFVEWARTGRLEMLLTFWITLGFWTAMRYLDGGRRRDAVLLGLAVAGGSLTKGPVGALPLGALVLALVILRRWSRRRLGDVALALGVAVALPLGWLGLAAATQGGIDRYVGVGLETFAQEVRARRDRHALYAAEVIGTGFLPWTLLLPATVVVLVRSWPTAWRPLLLPLLWPALVLALFAVLISPRDVYFLPVYPALALLTTWAWSSGPALARRWMAIPLGLAAAAAVVAGLAVAVSPIAIETSKLVTILSAGLGGVVAGVSAAGALGSILLLRRRRPHAAVAVLGAGALAILILMQVHVLAPRANRAHPTREAGARLAAALPGGAEVAYVDRKFVTGVIFYLPRRVLEVPPAGGLRALRERPDLHALVPALEAVYLRRGLCLPTRRLREEEIFGERYVLVDFKGTPDRGCVPALDG